jgi:glycosyltransferase involved in cell wall biosynthesis
MDEEGVGAGPTRNKAWRRASTDYVAFLDDDDELLPEHIEFCLKYATRTHADLVYPWFELVGWDEATPERPDPLAVPVNGRLVHPLGVAFGREQAAHLRKHAFIPATVLVKRSMLERVGGYPDHDSEEYDQFNGCEDWALLIRLLDAGARFAHVPQRTWRCHLGNGLGGKSWREPAV